MQDRVSTYPGRIKLTPVAGQTNVYDWERFDSPTVTGTPLNKATFLTDATASAIEALGVTAPTLPTEALTALATVLSGIGLTGIAHMEFGSYTGTGVHGSNNPNSLTFSFAPKMVIVIKDYYKNSSNAESGFIWVSGSTDNQMSLKTSVNGNTLSWYTTAATDGNGRQMNTGSTTYYYVAIGVIE